MFQHTIKLAIRSYWKNKSSFFINLVGLSSGLACVLLIYLWVNDEWSVDKFHEKDAQLYQIFQNYEFPHGVNTWKRTPLLLGNALEKNFPEVEKTVAISNAEDSPEGILSNGDQHLLAKGLYASKDYFEVFSFPVIEGDPSGITTTKNSIALSDQLALKLFNSTDIIGKNIHWKTPFEEENFHITGVFEEPPIHSTTQFDFIMSLQYFSEDEEYSNWNGDYVETFVLLNKGTDLQDFNQKINNFKQTQTNDEEEATLFAQQYSQKYLYGNYEDGKVVGGRIAYVKLFVWIAIFILLIACINFTNLSTAQASTKMRAVGVKKTIGANRSTLMLQFFTETFLMVFLSFCSALIMVKILLPQFNHITDKNLELVFDLNSFITLISILIFTALLAGSYAAFYLSGFKPAMVLKGKIQNTLDAEWIRKGLVVFQFGISIVFIIGVLVINQQMDFIQNKNLGYSKNQILSFERPSFRENSDAFLASLERISGVKQTATMFDNILSNAMNQSGYSWKGDVKDQKILFKSPIISYNLIETLEMQVLEGRTFSRDFSNEREKIIINEAALKMMNIEQPIGKVISYGHRGNKREIIGIVSNFHYGSIHHKVEPLIFRFSKAASNVIVKIEAGTEKQSIAAIEKVFNDFHPNYPFSYSFLDQDYQALYESESRVASLSKYFSGLAILISCLGLLGLAMFTAERRQREISVRKVLGASIANIVSLLSKDFLKLVVVAFFIATPLAYYAMQHWLSNFAYHVEIKWWVFVLAGMSMIGIAILTVSFQSIKAAVANPIDALKNE